MLKMQIPWTLKEVLAVHLLRLLIGLALVRFIYPSWLGASPDFVEITDRVVIIGLVWAVVRLHGGKLSDWGFTGKGVVRNVAVGLAAGALLLAFSLVSERIYNTLFFLAPTQHPLIARIESAASWRDLAVPLFLAGVAAPVAEELLYRLYTFNAVKARFGVGGGAVISAAIFSLFHFNPFWLAEVFAVGLGLALLYYWTGSLVSAIVAHSFVNTAKAAMFFLHLL